jgi:hypothetical protein
LAYNSSQFYNPDETGPVTPIATKNFLDSIKLSLARSAE